MKHGHYLFSCHDHVSHIPFLLLAFPQAKGWDSAGDLPERWSLVKPGIASLIFNDHLHPPRIGRKVVGWERCRIQTMSFLSAPRRATNSLYFSLLYWWPLLVVSWSSNGHQAVTVTWSSCLYRVLMLIFFTLPAMFFFPAVYLLWSTPVGFNMSQLPGTKISKASPTCCGRAKAGGPTPRPPCSNSSNFSARAVQIRPGTSPHPISWSGPWYQNLPYTVPSWMT